MPNKDDVELCIAKRLLAIVSVCQANNHPIDICGNKLAIATRILACAAATRRSAAMISGLRRNNSAGIPKLMEPWICGRGLGGKDYAWSTYVINYQYRDGHEICEQWAEDWNERCSLK